MGDHGGTILNREVASVLEEGSVLQERGNGRVVEHVIVDVRRGEPRLLQIVQTHDHTDGDGLLVGVEETAAGDALRAVADHRVGDTLVTTDVEAILQDLARQSDDGLDADRKVLLRFLGADASLLSDEGVDAVSRDDHVCTQFVFAGADADDLLTLDDQGIDLHARHDGHSGFLALFQQPRIELGAQNGHCVGRLAQTLVPVVNVDKGTLVDEAHAVAGNPALNGRDVHKVREHLLHDTAVEDSTGQVLRTRLGGALDQQDFPALVGEGVGAHCTRHAAANDDDVKVNFLGHIPLLVSGKRCGQRGHDLVDVAHDAVVGDLEDRRVLVVVDGHDDLGVGHTGGVLHLAGDAQCNVDVR